MREAARRSSSGAVQQARLDRRSQPAAERPRQGAGRTRGRHRAVLRIDHRRLAISGVHARASSRARFRAAIVPGTSRSLNQPPPNTGDHVAQRSGVVRELPGVFPRARDRAPVVGTGGRLAQLPRAMAQRGVRAILCRALRAEIPRRRRIRRRHSTDAPLGHERIGSGSGVSRLPRRAHQERGAGVSRGRSTTRARWCCTCCGGWWAMRRSSKACAGFTSNRGSQGRERRISGRRWKRNPVGRSIDSSSAGSTTARCRA